MDRLARRERFDRVFSPYSLALAGILVTAALLFAPGLAPRVAILLGAQAFTWISGRKVPLIGTFLVILGIVGANLLVPIGRILAVWGPFKITETALWDGIQKAITFEALIYVSKATIRSDLKIPGRLGYLMGTALRSYERILEIRVKIHPATFFEDLDALLLSVYDGESEERPKSGGATPGPRKAGTAILILLTAAAWLPHLLAVAG